MKENVKFPAKDGWIHAKLTLRPGVKITEKEALNFAGGGVLSLEIYEVGEFRCLKTVAHLYFRKHRLTEEQYEAVAHALGVPSDRDNLPLQFHRNRFICANHAALDELVVRGLATKTPKIEIYDGDRIYSITEAGQAVFRYWWSKRKNAKLCS